MDRLDPDRAAALEADFRERLNTRLEEARAFRLPGSGRDVEGRARRDEDLSSHGADIEGATFDEQEFLGFLERSHAQGPW